MNFRSPQTVPGNLGYSPEPSPRLIAYYPTKGTAMQVSEGCRRDRAVDESGNQIAIFGRRGSRPLNFEEAQRMFLISCQLFTVKDDPRENPHTLSASTASSNKAPAGFWPELLTMLKLVIQTGY